MKKGNGEGKNWDVNRMLGEGFSSCQLLESSSSPYSVLRYTLWYLLLFVASALFCTFLGMSLMGQCPPA
jgi:hypothetical protein